MKKIITTILLITTFFLAFAGERLIILHTNDTHSQIDPDFDGKGGILRRKVIIDSIRKAEQNVILVDAGDAVQGTLYFTLFGGEVENALMDSLGYDIRILGNHEFDNGMEKLAKLYKNTKSTKLSANYDFTNTVLNGIFKPYIIKEYDGKKIAFIGVNLNPTGIISEFNSRGIVYRNPLSFVDSLAGALKKNHDVDKVVAITHIGYKKGKEGLIDDLDLIHNSHNIDIVIGGHSHTTVNSADKNSARYEIPNADGRDVLIAQTGKAGKNLGYIEVELDDDEMEAHSQLIPITKKYDNRIDKSLDAFIVPYRQKVDSLMHNTIAYSDIEMNESNPNYLMNWTSDMAMKMVPDIYKGDVDFAVMNKGGIRRVMPQGAVSEGLIGAMYPFENFLVVLKIKGSELLKGFSVMAQRKGDAVSKGLDIKYGRNGKIVYAKFNGKKINKNKYYTILTLDYLANGNDYMKPFTTGKILAADQLKFGDRMMMKVKEMGKNNQIIHSTGEARMHK